MAALSKEEYLKRYISGDKPETKKRRKKIKPIVHSVSRIIDDDVDFNSLLPDNIENTLEEDVGDNEPTVAEFIDERPEHIKRLEEYRASGRWKTMNDKKNAREFGTVSNDSDNSDSDVSPVRRGLIGRNVNSQRNRHDSDSDQSPSRTKRHDSDSDQSPPRTKRHDSDSDQSPPRTKRHKDVDHSSQRTKRHDSDSDQSPRRRHQHHSGSDQSPPRRKNPNSDSVQLHQRSKKPNSDSDQSLPRRHRHNSDSDQSPPRRKRHNSDSDQSPPRRKRHNSDSDQSPPRRKKPHSDSDQSPPRRKRRHSDSDQSPPRKSKSVKETDKKDRRKAELGNTKKPSKTLSGAKAGLQSARDMKQEAEVIRKREEEAFKKIGVDKLGRYATTVHRDKSGKRRNLEDERQKEKEADRKKAEEDKKYMEWGQGLKQKEDREKKLQDSLHEIAKPLARYRDDEDLDSMLKDQLRDGDPMALFMKKKKNKNADTNINEKPKYRGPQPPPNRYGIPPGYRWDGVDRSNGFEAKLFAKSAERKAVDMMAYKWSTEDM
ncbi:BUD13 homolog [Gigantopelta aegis]|uniref:BUD13 homolog n=1 Tax=Gigantopelta aegis TaxID=1735272 RepID=UPI001B88AAF8|nr:BUD13 homolog [Gigantopelta aegis]